MKYLRYIRSLFRFFIWAFFIYLIFTIIIFAGRVAFAQTAVNIDSDILISPTTKQIPVSTTPVIPKEDFDLFLFSPPGDYLVAVVEDQHFSHIPLMVVTDMISAPTLDLHNGYRFLRNISNPCNTTPCTDTWYYTPAIRCLKSYSPRIPCDADLMNGVSSENGLLLFTRAGSLPTPFFTRTSFGSTPNTVLPNMINFNADLLASGHTFLAENYYEFLMIPQHLNESIYTASPPGSFMASSWSSFANTFAYSPSADFLDYNILRQAMSVFYPLFDTNAMDYGRFTLSFLSGDDNWVVVPWTSHVPVYEQTTGSSVPTLPFGISFTHPQTTRPTNPVTFRGRYRNDNGDYDTFRYVFLSSIPQTYTDIHNENAGVCHYDYTNSLASNDDDFLHEIDIYDVVSSCAGFSDLQKFYYMAYMLDDSTPTTNSMIAHTHYQGLLSNSRLYGIIDFTNEPSVFNFNIPHCDINISWNIGQTLIGGLECIFNFVTALFFPQVSPLQVIEPVMQFLLVVQGGDTWAGRFVNLFMLVADVFKNPPPPPNYEFAVSIPDTFLGTEIELMSDEVLDNWFWLSTFRGFVIMILWVLFFFYLRWRLMTLFNHTVED